MLHVLRVSGPNAWSFNGDINSPTLQPSVLFQSGHYAPDRINTGKCWCTYNAEHPEQKKPFICVRCHSFVTNGKIQFLGDCTHAMAGQTVDLLDCEDHEHQG
jgi:hypothetical protein